MSPPAHTHPRLCQHHWGIRRRAPRRYCAVGGARGGRFLGRRAAQARGGRARSARFNVW